MARRPVSDEMLGKIDIFLEQVYPESVKLADAIVAAGLDTKSQLRGFETLVNATTRFSEIINYIKNQAGKEKKKAGGAGGWAKVAPALLDQLSSLEQEAHRIGAGDPGAVLDLKLRLARGWAKQVVAHYLYGSALRRASHETK
ncbi:MAG: hypothetical protein HYX75_20975 [Acidobacteria bacterium]|nr:hypothetical protein [Acidobacteriota bacterium]